MTTVDAPHSLPNLPTSTGGAIASRPYPSFGRLLRDYFILTKPSIMLLLLVTTAPAMVLAEQGWPGWGPVLATLLGGVFAAGGAGALNMYIDRDIDGLMRRTRNRPIPSGRVPERHVLIFGLAMGLASGPWLWLTMNGTSALLAVGAFFFYVVPYSMYLKRRTVHNTVVGGVAGALPPLIGWAAITDSVTIEGLLLWAIVFFWQPPHFWALAIRLEPDYRNARIPMMPVVLGEHETRRQTLLYAVATVMLTLIFGAVAELAWIYFAAAVVGGVAFIAASLKMYRGRGLEGTKAMFRTSTLYLAALFFAMVGDTLIL